MASILEKLKSMFGPGEETGSSAQIVTETPATAVSSQESAPVSEPTPTPPAPASPPPMEELAPTPMMRTVIQAPVVSDAADLPDSEEILIRAQPSPTGDQCVFRINRPLFPGHSWFFKDFESAEGSPLAEVIFTNDEVETLLVHEQSFTITRYDQNNFEWEKFAREIGAVVRETLQEGGPVLKESIVRDMPDEEKIREDIQKVIDLEVNPGVAGHGGQITLTGIQGNTINIQMGGGCQGCSSADLTLKVGIHNAFRKAVPFVGAIYDETDHAAGLNPYFS